MKVTSTLQFVFATLGLSFSSFVYADLSDDIEDQINANQALVESGMETMSENLMAVFAHRGLAPADTLGGGIGGFEISLDLNTVDFDTDAIEEIAGTDADSDYTVSSFPVLKLSAAIGLPVVPIDLFVSYMDLGDLFSYVSAEGKYAIISGSTIFPAVSLGVNYSKTTMANALETETTGLDLAISKGFGVGVKVVPYAGIGYLTGTTRLLDDVIPDGSDVETDYDVDTQKLYVGASFQFALLNIVVQADQIGDYNAYSAKIGFRF